ncbi:MAG: hypothetical protein PF445_10785 [Melioribacteraceae bacterium]|jgi:hypothetical protein|nr:hypothetical protein [Melioribacteraceae bacterium]
MKHSKIISILFILTSIFYFGCSESLTPPIDDNSINIEFPIGKKAVYAVGLYEGESVDSLQAWGVNIFSLQFDTVLTKTDGIEYIGNIELFYSILDSNLGTGAEFNSSSSIKVSIDEKWVLFQNSNIIGSSSIFMKRNSILSDTTLFPTFANNQFPVFPKKIIPNTFYSVYRPIAVDSTFLAAQRDFVVKDFAEWNDFYGSNSGLYYTTEHVLKFENEMEFDFKGIIDERGVVISVFTLENFVLSTVQNPDGEDTVTVHKINRRIVDFTEPENINELSWYSDYVLENGLKYLEEK